MFIFVARTQRNKPTKMASTHNEIRKNMRIIQRRVDESIEKLTW